MVQRRTGSTGAFNVGRVGFQGTGQRAAGASGRQRRGTGRRQRAAFGVGGPATATTVASAAAPLVPRVAPDRATEPGAFNFNVRAIPKRFRVRALAVGRGPRPLQHATVAGTDTGGDFQTNVVQFF